MTTEATSTVPFPPQESTHFTFIDLFAGIGGFRIALQGLGGKCVFSSEWDKAAQETYFANFGETPHGDITLAEVKQCIPENFDILCAGFPCQPFSLAGKKEGFDNPTQGTLFFDILEIVIKHKPKILFLENVRNLVSHDKGRTFGIIKQSLEQQGYQFDYKIIDSSPLVPQKRVRCYIVCNLQGIKFEFPEISGEEKKLSSILEDNVDPSFTLSDRMWTGHINRSNRNIARGTGFTAFEADVNKPAHTLVARYYKDGKECLIPQEGRNPRMLTPRECARLQGFPEYFILPNSKTKVYKQMGNSVAIPVLQEIGKEICKQLITY